MPRPVRPLALVLILGPILFLAAPALAGPTHLVPSQARAHPQTATVDFSGIAALSNCSASVVRWPDSVASDKAVVLTNGHCTRFLGAREVLVDQPYVRSVTLLNPDGTDKVTVQTSRIVYATMFRTDVSLYELSLTYGQLLSTYDVPALTVAAQRSPRHTSIQIISGYWRRAYHCHLHGFVYRLHEYHWDWSQSLRYADSGCHIIGGTSGSPVLDPDTRTVIGVNNTLNEDGQRCTLDNPCEEARDGTITVHQGRGYGQETWWLTTCIDADRHLDLTLVGCRLPSPRQPVTR
jgi:hypothetical protein